MAVKRYDLTKCIGCGTCVAVCPMDVFRLDAQAGKSVIAYPESCQNCGQCYINCPGQSLAMAREAFAFPVLANR